MSSKWNDSSVKDLIFAILMSTSDGGLNIKANWDKVELSMKTWGYDFTKGAMSQHWSKKILKEFRQRHPDGSGNGDGGSAPATPASNAGGSRAPRTPKTPKTPASGKGKGKKRAAVDDYEEDDSSPGSFIADPIAKTKMPRQTSKKVKHEPEAEEEKEEEGVDPQPKAEEDDDYDFSLEV